MVEGWKLSDSSGDEGLPRGSAPTVAIAPLVISAGQMSSRRVYPHPRRRSAAAEGVLCTSQHEWVTPVLSFDLVLLLQGVHPHQQSCMRDVFPPPSWL